MPSQQRLRGNAEDIKAEVSNPKERQNTFSGPMTTAKGRRGHPSTLKDNPMLLVDSEQLELVQELQGGVRKRL